MAERVQLSQEEMAKISQHFSSVTEVTRTYGQLAYQLKAIQTDMHSLEDQMVSLETQRKSILDEIRSKYGVGDIDLSNGTFIPAPSVSGE